jgi:hypothetical protein
LQQIKLLELEVSYLKQHPSAANAEVNKKKLSAEK